MIDFDGVVQGLLYHEEIMKAKPGEPGPTPVRLRGGLPVDPPQCNKCNEYRDLIGKSLAQMKQITAFSRVMETSLTREHDLAMRRGSTLFLLLEEALQRETDHQGAGFKGPTVPTAPSNTPAAAGLTAPSIPLGASATPPPTATSAPTDTPVAIGTPAPTDTPAAIGTPVPTVTSAPTATSAPSTTPPPPASPSGTPRPEPLPVDTGNPASKWTSDYILTTKDIEELANYHRRKARTVRHTGYLRKLPEGSSNPSRDNSLAPPLPASNNPGSLINQSTVGELADPESAYPPMFKRKFVPISNRQNPLYKGRREDQVSFTPAMHGFETSSEGNTRPPSQVSSHDDVDGAQDIGAEDDMPSAQVPGADGIAPSFGALEAEEDSENDKKTAGELALELMDVADSDVGADDEAPPDTKSMGELVMEALVDSDQHGAASHVTTEGGQSAGELALELMGIADDMNGMSTGELAMAALEISEEEDNIDESPGNVRHEAKSAGEAVMEILEVTDSEADISEGGTSQGYVASAGELAMEALDVSDDEDDDEVEFVEGTTAPSPAPPPVAHVAAGVAVGARKVAFRASSPIIETLPLEETQQSEEEVDELADKGDERSDEDDQPRSTSGSFANFQESPRKLTLEYSAHDFQFMDDSFYPDEEPDSAHGHAFGAAGAIGESEDSDMAELEEELEALYDSSQAQEGEDEQSEPLEQVDDNMST